MEKELVRRLFALLMLVGAMMQASAYDNHGISFKVDSIYYRVLAKPAGTVAVTWAWWEESYTMSHLTVPDSVVNEDSIKYRVFAIDKDGLSWNANLTDVTLPEGLERIGSLAFEYSGIQTVNFPASLKKIGSKIFHKCPNKVKIDVAEGNENFAFENGLLYGLKDKRKNSMIYVGKEFQNSTFVVPDGIEIIDDGVFENSNLSYVILSPDVIVIGQGAFRRSDLESIIIPSGVKEIGARAFDGCENLSKVIIGESVESIGEDAFTQYVNALLEIEIKAAVPPVITPYKQYSEEDDEEEGAEEAMSRTGDELFIFSSDTYSNVTLTVPKGSKEAYASAPGWRDFAKIVESEESSLEFVANDNLKVSTLPGTLILESQEAVEVKVYGANGTLVYSGRVDGQVSVPLNQGVYILTAADKSQKVIIR